MGGGKDEGRGVGGPLSPFSRLSHAQMFGEGRRSERRIRRGGRGAEKVNETTSAKDMNKRREGSNTENIG